MFAVSLWVVLCNFARFLVCFTALYALRFCFLVDFVYFNAIGGSQGKGCLYLNYLRIRGCKVIACDSDVILRFYLKCMRCSTNVGWS